MKRSAKLDLHYQGKTSLVGHDSTSDKGHNSMHIGNLNRLISLVDSRRPQVLSTRSRRLSTRATSHSTTSLRGGRPRKNKRGAGRKASTAQRSKVQRRLPPLESLPSVMRERIENLEFVNPRLHFLPRCVTTCISSPVVVLVVMMMV